MTLPQHIEGFKGTPGPWHNGEGRGERIIYDARGWAIADAKVFHGNHRGGEDVANAHLIAAAPDLLEALRAAAKKFRRYEEMHNEKGTVDGAQKAAANASMARTCEAAISRALGKDQ